MKITPAEYLQIQQFVRNMSFTMLLTALEIIVNELKKRDDQTTI